jgi:hypothetical protein
MVKVTNSVDMRLCLVLMLPLLLLPAAVADHDFRNGGRDFFAGQDVGAKLQLTCAGFDNVMSVLSLASRQGGVPDVEDLMSHVAAVAGVDVGADTCVAPTSRDVADLTAVRDVVAQQWEKMLLAASGMNKSDLGPLRPVFFAEEYETEYTNSFDDSMDRGTVVQQQLTQEQAQTQQCNHSLLHPRCRCPPLPPWTSRPVLLLLLQLLMQRLMILPPRVAAALKIAASAARIGAKMMRWTSSFRSLALTLVLLPLLRRLLLALLSSQKFMVRLEYPLTCRHHFHRF